MDQVAFLAVPCNLLFGLLCASRDSATVLCVFRYVSTRAVRASKSPNVQDIRRVRYSGFGATGVSHLRPIAVWRRSFEEGRPFQCTCEDGGGTNATTG